MKNDSTDEIERYISGHPKGVQEALKRLRMAIRKAAPKAEEVMSYRMPAVRYNGMLVWYAGYKKHIGFYPKESVIKAFKKELSAYKCAKGTVRFPLGKPLPLRLIARIVRFRVRENSAGRKKSGK